MGIYIDSLSIVPSTLPRLEQYIIVVIFSRGIYAKNEKQFPRRLCSLRKPEVGLRRLPFRESPQYYLGFLSLVRGVLASSTSRSPRKNRALRIRVGC